MNLLFFWSFLFTIPADSSYIHIFVHVDGQDMNQVALMVPVHDNLFLSYNIGDNELVKYGNDINFKVPLKDYSFFLLKINKEINIPIALKANDSVFIYLKRKMRSEFAEYDIEFKGNNQLAHAIYQKRFFPPGKNFDFFDDAAYDAKTLNNYYTKSKNYINSLTYVWDSLKKVQLINDDVYQLYKSDTRSNLHDKAILNLSKVNKSDTSYKTYVEQQKLKLLMYQQGEASNPLLLKTNFGEFFYSNYLLNKLNSDNAVTDKALKASEFGYFYYFDSAYREKAWGGLLYFLKMQYPNSNNRANLDAFKNYYPNSIYLQKIISMQDSIVRVRKSFNVPIQIDTAVYTTLHDILSTGKSRFTFIDLWATWCLPCIAEFSSLDSLTPFLKSKSIRQVFISLDKRAALNKWKDFILKNNIPGNHYLSTKSMEDELLKILYPNSSESDLFIPRYLLYDKQNNKFHIELPKPSTGVVLINKIEHILSEK